MTLAHVFWEGPITKYEIATLLSLKAKGFEVNFWSFTNYDLPDGIISRDAEEILSKSFINTYTQTHWDEKENRMPKESHQWSITLYSDMFRYEVLNKFGGWWFDLDVICLRSAEDFDALTKDKDIVIAYTYQDKGQCGINGAILSIPNKTIAKEILDMAKQIIVKSNVHEWGAIGPEMILNYLRKKSMTGQILHEDLFNPIGGELKSVWVHESIVDKSLLSKFDNIAYAIHWYNNMVRAEDKATTLPDKNSVLGKHFYILGIYDL